ncbi:hypothetical protein BG015_009152 [Linnemannia schmuckeri]|uniref:Glycosyltransferase family 61 protein n=1 Tax=Linnemannia schmuckeri TaxID=64567 RepID=A0A9P5V9T1_9FUNG|nr:hypothetical protein BG015_009152 [Linnemannia schmuckeri]
MLKNFLVMKRCRRFVLTLPIFVGIILILSLQTHLSQYNNNNVDIKGRPFLEHNNHWRPPTVARPTEVPDATWTCTGDDLPDNEKDSSKNRRSRQCVVQNLCVDRKGAFIRSSEWFPKSMPEINLIGSDVSMDFYWRPRVERSGGKPMQAHYIDETLFVHGLIAPDHFSHWLYNGMMPLYSTIKRFNGTKDSWTFRARSFVNHGHQGKWEMRHVFQTGYELVVDQDELTTEFQTLPPQNAPICFRQAVIGLGSQCGLVGCENNIPSDVYSDFRDLISDYYWRTPQTWERHLAGRQESIDIALAKDRQVATETNTTSIPTANTQKTPLRCLDLVRYYNFEPSTGQDRLVAFQESKNRVGQISPDTVDPEVDHSANGPRRLVVAIIQRFGSRRVVNDKELVEGLVAAGYRVKWITFDSGCGLPETAYLLRDVNVMLSPHGNSIGSSIFMPSHNPVPTIVSLDPSRYSESWFINTASAMGQRFMQTVCGPNQYLDDATKARCPYYKDEAGAYKLIARGAWIERFVLGLSDEQAKSYRDKAAKGKLTPEAIEEFRNYVTHSPTAQQLAKKELDILIGPEIPTALITKYGDGVVWHFLETFWRDVPRYVDVPRMVAFMHELQQDQEREQIAAATAKANTPQLKYQQYLGYVRQSRACGIKYCKGVLRRNVIEPSRVFGVHSIDNPSRWGQSTLVDKNVFEGLEGLPNWLPDSLYA